MADPQYKRIHATGISNTHIIKWATKKNKIETKPMLSLDGMTWQY